MDHHGALRALNKSVLNYYSQLVNITIPTGSGLVVLMTLSMNGKNSARHQELCIVLMSEAVIIIWISDHMMAEKQVVLPNPTFQRRRRPWHFREGSVGGSFHAVAPAEFFVMR